MKNHSIQSHTTGKTLYEGSFVSFRTCLEQAVLDKIDLSHADFRNLNLANACLDDGLFAGADFSGGNLTGANLSEANLKKSKFQNIDLYNTCLSYSDIQECDFSGAGFGATDITAADLSGSRFSTLSCFSLDFASASNMRNCYFRNDEGRQFTMSRPPIVLRGIGTKLIILADDIWMHGSSLFSYPEQFRPADFLKTRLYNDAL